MLHLRPDHLDTVLTMLVCRERAQYLPNAVHHLTVDKLYRLHVQWNNPQHWINLILHPGMMHTLMSFLGCVEKLMMASGIEILISAAFGGIISSINRKAWTNALQAYRLIITLLLQSFYSSDTNDITGAERLITRRQPESTRLEGYGCTTSLSLFSLRLFSCMESGKVLPPPTALSQGDATIFFTASHHNYAFYLS